MFSDLPDPRAENAHHRLSDLVFIALAASLCGAQSAVDYAQFARSKQVLLAEYLGPFAPPSHDTFSRVFRLLDPEAFAAAFIAFTQAFAGSLAGVVALDGKALRRAYDCGARAWPPIVVSAWAAQARVVLGALKADAAPGKGEASTALRLVGMLALEDTVVTADALHCNRKMAAAIRRQGGEYVLALKGNRGALKADVEDAFARHTPTDTACQNETGHGRAERRSVRVLPAERLARDHGFAGLAQIVEVTSQRGDTPPARRLYIASKVMRADEMLAVTRAHWSVENNLHWSLDVTFGEDQIRARKDNAPANLALITRQAKNLLERINDPGTSIRRRIKRCAWEDDYLRAALTHMR